MMLEVPSGDNPDPKWEQEAVETAPPCDPKIDAAANETKNRKNLKTFAFLGAIVVLAVIAVLVAVLPSWGTNCGSDGCTTTSSNLYSGNETESPLFYEANEGAFRIKIPLLSSDITKPYTSVEEAKYDIEQLAKFVVNNAITERSSWGADGPMYFPDKDGVALESGAEGDRQEGAPVSSSTSDSGAFGGASSFETYQQEAGVVRSDSVKSNGVHVFAALTDKILVWDLQGSLLQTVVMTPINVTKDSFTGTPYVLEEVQDKASDEAQDENEIVEEDATAERTDYNWVWNPQPYIQALMLNPQGTRLVAIVGGYGVEYTMGQDLIPVIQDYKGTRIIVYDIQDDGSLAEVSQTDINGYHANSYSVEDHVHIVTKTSLQTWDHLIQPIDRFMPDFEGMSDEEYVAAATVKAEELIPSFVDKVMELYTEDGEVILSRLAVFAESISTDSQMTDSIFSPGIANSITEISSFDMGTLDPLDNLIISTSATLQPGYWGYVYATTDWIWVADQGWRFVEDSNTYVQDTIFLGFRLDGASSTFSVFGSVPGSLLSQFSVDFYQDPVSGEEFIRAATTINTNWGMWWGGRPMATSNFEEQANDNASRTKNQVIIMKVPMPGGDLQAEDELVQVGSLELGKKDETITAVRFFDSISYVVTFERTDPFYVLDLSDPTEPKILGELEIPGFSEFMHPIKDDNSVLVTIGRDADDQGIALGFQVSIFDSTDPMNPLLLDRYVLDQRWSDSSASWDERAFRYVRVGDLGRLIIPINIYAGYDERGNQIGENFEGFFVFGVDLSKSENIITKELEIDHTNLYWRFQAETTSQQCYCFDSLPERSMVFNGNLMTIKNQNVASTDLVSETITWNMTLDKDVTCCGNNVVF
ncbi:beta propeller domain containing protein [Nitzschia inconspicua]|uniref:Beta propeller domain containing protein n=1 Tax=Nitzschia inconspicua TaxID=303405 RepID=A0A9K3PQD9_9STRA|nr:beta propeller domain containing protein [Nitzschia inconspicua]